MFKNFQKYSQMHKNYILLVPAHPKHMLTFPFTAENAQCGKIARQRTEGDAGARRGDEAAKEDTRYGRPAQEHTKTS